VDDLSWKGSYTRFGKVLEGLDVAQKITKGDRIQAVRILKRHGTPTDFPYAPRVLWIPKLDPKAAAGQ
jgi:cyclophilin family peptidyl-prolyl cis-trans isomerase